MSKELDALERLYKCNDDDYTMGYQHHDYKLLQEALQRLESIDNANPSEALKDLKELHELAYGNEKTSWKIDDIRMSSHIKQALIKAQEQEKVLEIIKKKHINVSKFIDMFIFEKGNELRKYNEELYVYDRITQKEFDLLKRYFNEQD